MNKKGFTLAELLGVIVILGLIALVAFPAILDTIKKNKNNINNATYQIIYSGADLYITNHKSEFELYENATYCIQMQELVNEENIPSDIKNPDTNEKFDLNRYIKVEVKNNKYNYTLVGTECTEVINN